MNDTPLDRWLNLVARGLHLAAVIGLGAALLGAPLNGQNQALAVLLSGAALLVLDWRLRPQMFSEWAGAAVLIKMALVAWMAIHAEARSILFWVLVPWSVLFAHAPSRVRHAPWRRRRP